MTKKEIVLWLVLADFVALTGYAIVDAGYTTFVAVAFEFARESAWGLQILVDFGIALALVLAWIVSDARSRGVSAWPFVLLTLTLGSIGPLAYLVRRERQTASTSVAGAPQTA